jgi:hypothetical protein
MQVLDRKRGLKSSDIMPMFALGTLGLHVLMLLLLFGNVIGTWSLARKPAPSMVQLTDGRAVAMTPVDHLARTPEELRRFTKDSLALMFTWSSKIQAPSNTADLSNRPATMINDPGVRVQHGKVTTAAWQASFSFKEDFRTQLLDEIAKMTPSSVFGGGAQSVLSFESISDPKATANGQWQIDVVSNLLVFDDAHPQGLAIPFNKTIFLSAVEPTTDPLPDISTPIQRALYRVQQSGVQITQMQDLDLQHIGDVKQ